MEIAERLKTVCSFLNSPSCHSDATSHNFRILFITQHLARGIGALSLKLRKCRMKLRSVAGRIKMRRFFWWGRCCVITASLCRTACWDSTIVCVKGLQLRFLHGQRPRAPRLWNCCSGLFIVMYAQGPLYYLQSIYNYPALQPNILFMSYNFKNAAW